MKKKLAHGEGTIIGKGTVINGNMESDATLLRVDGKVNGDVTTKGELVVGPQGSITGEIKAGALSISGSVRGNVTSDTTVDILTKGSLIGDVDCKGITIDHDCIIQGKCNMDIVMTSEGDSEADAKTAESEPKAEDTGAES